MPRVQVGYDPRAEALQTTAAPNIQTEQARNDPNGSKAFQLAAALGAPSVQQGLQSLMQKSQERDMEKAQAYANSMTVEELGKQIKDGKILPSQSPAYVATVQHIYGENTLAGFERDTISKMERGELKFKDQAEIDAYLKDYRDKTLGGQSDYAVAGFDKKYNQFRLNLGAANAKLRDAEFVTRGTQEAQDNLTTIMDEVKGKPPEEQAAAIVERYQLLRKTSLLKDEQGKEALSQVMAQAVATGNTALIEQLAKTKLDNGLSIGAVLGAKQVAAFQQQAVAVDDRTQRQRIDVEIRPFLDLADKGELTGKKQEEFDAWIKKNEKYVTTSTIHAITNGQRAAEARAEKAAAQAQLLNVAEQSQAAADQAIATSVSQGNFAFLPGQKVINPSTGAYEELGEKQKKKAEDTINKMVTANNLPLDKQMQLWSTNGLQNPEWEKQIQAGVSNVASVGWAYDGKNVGQLNPQGQAAIARYIELAAVNPGEADKYAGSKENQRLLSDIKFMMEKGGMPNVNDAAAFVNQVNRRGIEVGDAAIKRDQIKGAVDDIVNPSFYSGTVNWVTTLFGGNEQVNLTAIGSDIRRRAELLVQSGQVPDAKAAVKSSVEYFANPAVTTKINNTLYFNKDLPTVPKGENTGDWMERFIKEVPGKIATDQKMDGSRVRLEPNTTGGFTAWVGGVPITDDKGTVLNYSKNNISEWINNAHQSDLRNSIAMKSSATRYENWAKRVMEEARSNNNLPYGNSASLAYLTSKGAYEYFKSQNALDKPYSDLTDILKKKGK